MNIAALIAAQSEEQTSQLFLKPTDDLLYAMDLQDVDEQYMLTDTVFNSCGLDLTSEKPEFRRVVTMDNDGVVIQYLSRYRILFNYKQTCESIWMLAHLLNRQDDRKEYAGIQDRENTLAMKFRVTDRLPSGKLVSLNQRVVCRRFLYISTAPVQYRSTL
ncbi:Hypothetical protein PHPALM_36272 [Phytophthora palmivora]|uniref:Uncharacterized protein n=1 Tax=Phytophthora palmivora TaxID=4796 RepID=A0A2P4X0D1_9STRA|nr:Hypothetical protein PHPALM_36272 [Phytophthora palmivora]